MTDETPVLRVEQEDGRAYPSLFFAGRRRGPLSREVADAIEALQAKAARADELEAEVERLREQWLRTPLNPDAPHPLAYPVDPTDRDGEQVPTWELPGRFVRDLGDEWECWRLGAPHPMWTRPSPRATTEGLFLVRRVAPPAPPQPETVTERERLAMLLDAWFSVDAHRGIVPDETELDLSYEVAPLTYGDLRAIRKALADGGEL